MHKSAESKLKLRSLIPWLLAIVVHMSLVMLAIVVCWCALPESEQVDSIVPTVTFSEAPRPRIIRHKVRGCFPRPKERWVTVCVLHRPLPTKEMIKHVSISESLAISDTWGRNVALPVEVTQPYRNEAQDLPIEPFRAGVICVFHSQADRGPGLVLKIDPLAMARVMMPGLQSARDVIHEQIGGQAFFRQP